MKRHVVIFALKAEHKDLEIVSLVKVGQLFLVKVCQKKKKPKKTTDRDTTAVAKHK